MLTPSDTPRILIDSGPSRRGWSYYSTAFRCLHLHGLKQAGLIDDRRDPLTRGSMGHVGTAHLHARWMAEQNGQDPDTYYEPEDAIREYAYRHQEGLPHLDRMLETYRRYVARYPEPPGRRILGVEIEVAGVLGWLDGAWGLWALGRVEDVLEEAPRHVSGRLVAPAKLDCHGHREHGQNLYITRKLDIVIEDRLGGVYVEDFKYKAIEVQDSTAKRYAMSGEFAVSRILASQVWERFSGLALWMVQTQDPWRVAKPAVPPTPWRDALFPRDLHRMAHVIAQLELTTPPHEWPMAQNELTCVGRYEKDGCPAMAQCMRGPLA